MTRAMTAEKASRGGKRRIYLHGNPGTKDGRRLGGLNSLLTHRKNKTGFKTLHSIRQPKYSERLAELLGILAGDGHVSDYQVSVVTNAQTDYEHALHVRELLIELFQLPVSLTRRKNTNAVIVLLSSKEVCSFLRVAGMSTSHKTRDQLCPPQWIFRNKKFTIAFLQGLIDTDGSVYLDRHIVKGKSYSSVCIGFSNASLPLLDFVETTLKKNAYTPTRWGRNVRLRRRSDVVRYVEEIGFHNPKHAVRIML